ncbi:hypothetical protein U1Q18_036702 [Sarracenia purpurea var. burkii]
MEPYELLPKPLSRLHSYSCTDAPSLHYPLRPSPVPEACLVRATKQSKLTGSNVVEESNRQQIGQSFNLAEERAGPCREKQSMVSRICKSKLELSITRVFLFVSISVGLRSLTWILLLFSLFFHLRDCWLTTSLAAGLSRGTGGGSSWRLVDSYGSVGSALAISHLDQSPQRLLIGAFFFLLISPVGIL